MSNSMTDEKTKLSTERTQLIHTGRVLDASLKNTQSILNLIYRELTCRENINYNKYFIDRDTRHIEGLSLLSNDEIEIITTTLREKHHKSIDITTTHTSIKVNNVFLTLELDRCLKYAIDIKKRYPKWKLSNITTSTSNYSAKPSCTYYTYTYIDEEGDSFNKRYEYREEQAPWTGVA